MPGRSRRAIRSWCNSPCKYTLAGKPRNGIGRRSDAGSRWLQARSSRAMSRSPCTACRSTSLSAVRGNTM